MFTVFTAYVIFFLLYGIVIILVSFESRELSVHHVETTTMEVSPQAFQPFCHCHPNLYPCQDTGYDGTPKKGGLRETWLPNFPPGTDVFKNASLKFSLSRGKMTPKHQENIPLNQGHAPAKCRASAYPRFQTTFIVFFPYSQETGELTRGYMLSLSI